MNQPEELIGRAIGNYQVTRCLGVGGMGVVYEARHPRIGTSVAIKVLLPQFVSDPQVTRRFFEEARATNRIDHRGIVRIHDCGSQHDVGVYLVMEYLRGQTCTERLEQGGLFSTGDACDFLAQTSAALKASHRAGIVHRDLKPSNIFLLSDCECPHSWRVKILDFGIAKLLGDPGALDDPDGATKTGSIIGSPLYMAPEQCICAKTVDHRADIYALGAIVYRGLGGRCPHLGATLGQLILSHLKEKPPHLSRLNPRVSPALARLVHRALEADRERRYGSMAELRADLSELLAERGGGRLSGTNPGVTEPGTGDGATLVAGDTTLAFDPARCQVTLCGTMRLANMRAYAPVREFLQSAAARVAGTLTLDLRELSFLNSSGITTFTLFILGLRKEGRIGLRIVGSSSVSWQKRSARNFVKLWPAVELVWE